MIPQNKAGTSVQWHGSCMWICEVRSMLMGQRAVFPVKCNIRHVLSHAFFLVVLSPVNTQHQLDTAGTSCPPDLLLCSVVTTASEGNADYTLSVLGITGYPTSVDWEETYSVYYGLEKAPEGVSVGAHPRF
jgi:hypothetical protein